MEGDVHVYIICHGPNDGEVGPVKVGMATDPFKRLASLQSGNPNRLCIWRTFPTPDREIARAIERGFHHVQRKKRLSGEWFDLNPRQASFLMRMNFECAFAAHGMSGDLVAEALHWIDELAIYHDSYVGTHGAHQNHQA
jgi:hypothetical protein